MIGGVMGSNKDNKDNKENETRIKLCSASQSEDKEKNVMSLKTLIIEDDYNDYELLENYLEGLSNFKFYITHAATFDQGLQKLKEAKDIRFDIILMDLTLKPHSYNINLVKMIKEYGAPILPISGTRLSEGQRLELKQIGIDVFLPKIQLSPGNLSSSINQAMNCYMALHVALLSDKVNRFDRKAEEINTSKK